MPKLFSLTVEDYPGLRKDAWYRLRVISVKKNRVPAGLQVELEHIDESQAGRKHVITFPLPLRPGGPTAEFLRACGFDLAVGTEVQPQEAVGKTVLATFGETNDGPWEVTAWNSTPEGKNHDA